MAIEVVHRGPNSEYNIQNARDPDELFREGTRRQEITPRDHECDAQDEDEEDQGVRVERKGILAVVYSPALKTLVSSILLNGES